MSLQEHGIDAPEAGSGTYATTCPICSPHRNKKNDRCLTVYYDQGNEGQFKCHHCESFGFVDSGWKHIATEYSSKTKHSVTKKREKQYNRDIDLPEPSLNQKLYKAASDMFTARGISWDVVESNKISWGFHYFRQIQKEAPAIMFPYYKNGQLVNIKYKGKDPSNGRKIFTQVKNAEKTVFGYDNIRDKSEIILCEGEMDKLALETAGFTNVASCPDGAPSIDAKNYSSKFDFLKSIEDIIKNAKKVFLATDGDAPGRKLEEELSRRIGKHKCYRISYPEECKDSNDVLIKHGKEAVADLILEAKPYPIDGVYNVREFHKDLLTLYKNGFVPGVETGYSSLKGKINFKAGQATVVTGLPGSGKSILFKNIAMNIAKIEGWRFAFFDPENTPPERFVAEMSMVYLGKHFDKNRTNQMSEGELATAESFLDDHFQIIHNEDYDMPSLDEIIEKATQLVFREGINAIVIDPFNNLSLSRGDKARDEYLNDELKKIMAFSRRTGVHVFVVAHPTALKPRGKQKRIKPTAYDINGGAAWYNTFDNIIVVHREELDKPDVGVFVDKVRFFECGKAGTSTYLKFDTGSHTYIDRSAPRDDLGLPEQPPHPADDDEAPF